ncbi:MAG: glycosyltransferase involved in cell wall biosynthesis [Flavobacteriales bacterium]|jgi:glycosyltransferase involved in cell wall biosynthesis|tara:strand:+ start:2712 stop:3917 length:1206 start_codon:yes stop_codon:yes gene_type:complete
MKILFITDNFPPEVNAPATRTFEHCKEWVKKGDEVTVITCAPNFPKGKVYEGYKNKLYQKEEIEGIKVIRVWSYISANEGFAKRIIDFLSFAFMAFWVGLFKKTDVIIATSPQFFTTWTAETLATLKRKPWVFELRDIWPESIRAVGAISGDSKIFKFLEKLELRLYKRASRVISVTESFKRNLIERGIDGEKVKVVLNGANLERFSKMKKDAALVEKYNLEGKFVVGYVGTHGMAHKLDFILNSWPKDNPNFHLILMGDGAEKSKLVELAKTLNIPNISFIPSMLKEDVPAYLSLMDVSLVPLKKSDLFKTVIPSKIFENSAMQIPILLGVEGESADIIQKYNAGLCFEPENKEDFLTQLNLLKEDKTIYENCQAGCLTLAKEFDRKKMAEKMRKFLLEI